MVEVSKVTAEVYTLQSAAWLHAPGFIQWLIAMYQTDQTRALQLFHSAYSAVPEYVLEAVLDGSNKPTVDGETVIIRYTY